MQSPINFTVQGSGLEELCRNYKEKCQQNIEVENTVMCWQKFVKGLFLISWKDFAVGGIIWTESSTFIYHSVLCLIIFVF